MLFVTAAIFILDLGRTGKVTDATVAVVDAEALAAGPVAIKLMLKVANRADASATRMGLNEDLVCKVVIVAVSKDIVLLLRVSRIYV
jgi:hypothetical protein